MNELARITLPCGGICLGVGTDIVDVARIQKALERHGERFLGRVFTAGERAYCESMADPHPHFAARFAAKEAVSKAFTTGIGSHLGWTDIEVIKGMRREPYIELHGGGAELLEEVGAHGVLVSLSHTKTVALAVAVLVGKGAGD